MKPSHQAPRSYCTHLVFMIAFLLLTLSVQAQNKGWKEKINPFNNKGKSSEIEENSGEATTTLETPPGMQTVLLISEPIRKVDVPKESTIAFVEFKHIEEDIVDTQSHSSKQVTTEIKVGDTTQRTSSYSWDTYNGKVCAAQMASALAQHLADLDMFKVVTRENISDVLEEQNFANSGSVSSKTAVELGELVGADILIYGQAHLCVSSKTEYEKLTALAASGAQIEGKEGGGLFSGLIGTVKELKPEKLRALLLAQIQFIESESGEQIFTASLTGEFFTKKGLFAFDMTNRELIARAADDLANNFIDMFLARREAKLIHMYTDSTGDFNTGIELIRLGNCPAAATYFEDFYNLRGQAMTEQEVATLMYNHGIALMCSNEPQAALDRLWASLRLLNVQSTYEAIAFTNDLIDRGRNVLEEGDDAIRHIRVGRYPSQQSAPRATPTVERSPAGSM